MRRSPRRDFLLNAASVLGLGIVSGCSRLSGSGARPAKVPRIGLFAPEPNPAWDAFDLGLRDHGYIEGQNIVVERRWGPPERFQALADELVALQVDVLMASLRLKSKPPDGRRAPSRSSSSRSTTPSGADSSPA